MTHLRRYLERTGALPSDQLDMALRRQQIYGGSLDTVLLELDLVDAHSLGELLTQACGLPLAPVDLIDDAPVRPWDRLPEDVLEIGWAVPLATRGDQVWIAVHPDLPNERLGALYRSVPHVQPFVIPECCLEKIAAERNGSVVPQRYAVRCVAYLSAMRRRPSVSDTALPVLEDLGSLSNSIAVLISDEDDDALASEDAERSTSRVRGDSGEIEDEFERRPTIVFEPPRETTPASSKKTAPPIAGDAPREPSPGAPPAQAPSDAAHAIVLTPVDAVVQGAPPVRFTARGTLVASDAPDKPADPTQLANRLASARAQLEAATTRDAAIEALTLALSILSSRTALLRVRSGELVGLSTPRSALPDLGGKVVGTAEGTSAQVMAAGSITASAADDTLRRLLELGPPIPFHMRRIDVAGRPALVAYIDHGGRDITPVDLERIAQICGAASRALETVIKLRHGGSRPEIGDATGMRPSPLGPPPLYGTTNASSSWQPPRPPIVDDAPAPAGPRPRSRTIVDGSPPLTGVPAQAITDRRITAAIEGLPLPEGGVLPGRPRPTEGYPGLIDDDAEDHDGRGRAHLLTIHAMPPPPPLPPPPPMGTAGAPEGDRVDETLMGLPPPVSQVETGPRFVPPPLDDRDNSGIIPLASPIDQPSMRGRIELDDDEWDHPGKQLASESQQRRIDTVLRGIATGVTNVSELRAMGEPALLRLAAQFPGPLEILRRDLRALPPPSAHGPLVRTAIRIGAELVPHLVDLFDHPSPDVRFYAAFVFQELRDSRAMRPLSELAFDTNGDVRVIAMRVLETYSRVSGFADAARVVRAQLDSTNRTRQLYAARAVGTLRDIDAVAKLIDLLSSRDRFVQEAALESLCSITGQQLGLKPHRWKTWHAENGHRHRIEWIIESLRHRDLPVRRWAADELTRITGHRVPFSPMGDKKAQQLAVSAWTDWWSTRGRAQLHEPA